MVLARGGDFEHLRAEIETSGFRAISGERERNIAGAAAQIERAVAGFYFCQFDDAAFPEPVQAEALQVVDQIVTPRDAGEKVVDLGGALFAGNVKGVAHAGSLAQWPEPKSKPQKFCFASLSGFC